MSSANYTGNSDISLQHSLLTCRDLPKLSVNNTGSFPCESLQVGRLQCRRSTTLASHVPPVSSVLICSCKSLASYCKSSASLQCSCLTICSNLQGYQCLWSITLAGWALPVSSVDNIGKSRASSVVGQQHWLICSRKSSASSRKFLQVLSKSPV